MVPLIVVEVLDAQGEVRARHRFAAVTAETMIRIGRAVICDVILDDPHVAAEHLSLRRDAAGAVRVTDLGSANGLTLSGKRIANASELALSGPMLSLGRTRLRIRTEAETLAPELVDRAATRPHRSLLVAMLCAAGMFGFSAYDKWLEAPTNLVGDVASEWFALTALITIWVGLWALVTRINIGAWRWTPHIAVACLAMLMSTGGAWLLEMVCYAFQANHARAAGLCAIFLLGAATLYAHLRIASRQATRRIATVAVLVTGAIVSLAGWSSQQSRERDVSYVEEIGPLFPPAVRLARATPSKVFLDELGTLKRAADDRRITALTQRPDDD